MGKRGEVDDLDLAFVFTREKKKKKKNFKSADAKGMKPIFLNFLSLIKVTLNI